MSKPTLLCAAEPWGFGPAATLMAILTHDALAGDCVFAGTGSALDLAGQSPAVFRDVIGLEHPVDAATLPVRADRVLSVMDPWAALWAVRQGVPCTYVDILTWAWDWDRADWPLHRERAHTLRSASRAELVAASDSDIDPIFLGYLWSDEVFAQRLTHPTRTQTPRVPVRWVGAIIRTQPRSQGGANPVALVSLSGGLSPLVTMPAAGRYCEVVSAILRPCRDLLGTDRVVVNPRLAPCMIALGWDAQPLSYDAYRDALANCSFLLCPAGLGSVFEAAASGIPIVFLPEQHNLHVVTYQAFAHASPEDFPALFLSNVLAVQATGDQQRVLRQLDEAYGQLLQEPGGPGLTSLAATLRRAAERLQDARVRRRIVDGQRQGIAAAVGDFEGAAVIASHVGAALEEGTPRRSPAE